MWRRRAMGMGVAMVMAVAMMVVVGRLVRHTKTLHYNITGVHAPSSRHTPARVDHPVRDGNLNWASLAGMSQILLALLVPVIHLGTLMVPAGTSSAGLVSRFCCPGSLSVLALGIVAGNRHVVSPSDPAVRGMAGAARDQGRSAHHARRLTRAAFAASNPDKTTPQTEAVLISNTNRCARRSDHPHGRVGVTGAVEIDVNDPQDE